jgi:cobalt-zinc-cadmium efflux system outer membrane protein
VIATLGLPLPFFSNNEPERAEARAALELALAERRQAEARVAAEVTRAYRAATGATRRLEAFGSDVLPRFEENLAALKRAYELGEIDIVGLAGGRERFLAAQRDALTAQEDYFTALAELEHAVGVDVIDATLEDKR